MPMENQSAGDGAERDGDAQAGNPPGTQSSRPEGVALAPPCLPLRAGHLSLRALIDLYFAHYGGRDGALLQRLGWWGARLGHVTLEELSDDEIHSAVETLATQPSRYYAGVDASGNPIYRSKRRPITTATLNRYIAALSGVVTWAIKKRIAPKGFVHPCRTIERRPENNERVRFLSADEQKRLLDACSRSSWPKLQLLVVMALTTGARKGELLGLHWGDVDVERRIALCGRTKNGDPKALPLVEEALRLLAAHRGAASTLVFGSPRAPSKPFGFKGAWNKAVSAAKLRDFRFHDLRHTCASMRSQSCSPRHS